MTDQPTSASTLPALKLSNVFKSYKDGPRVLTDFSLDLRPGCFCVLLGSSGSGKSTLLRCIVGLAPVDSGDIRLHGVRLTKKQRRHVGMVHQDFGLTACRKIMPIGVLANCLAARNNAWASRAH